MYFYQIENEYGNVESSFHQKGKDYVKWAARIALELDARVPWVMCRQADAPDNIVIISPLYLLHFIFSLDFFFLSDMVSLDLIVHF